MVKALKGHVDDAEVVQQRTCLRVGSTLCSVYVSSVVLPSSPPSTFAGALLADCAPPLSRTVIDVR